MTTRRENQAVFADTGYWYALANPDDGLHTIALGFSRRYRSRRMVTSELVLVEFLDSMCRRGAYRRRLAIEMIGRIQGNSNMEIVPMDTELFEDAVKRYGSRLDQRWSLTDCVSFLVMERRGILKALAHDRDFAAAGFRPLLRDT